METNPVADARLSKTPEEHVLSLLYQGGIADSGALILHEYATSLEGWRGIFQLLGEIYFHAFPELRQVRGNRLLRIEIRAEHRGSWETVLYFFLAATTGGIIGNRADAAVVWAFSKLVEWYRDAIATLVRRKSQTTDITAITASMRQLLESFGYHIYPSNNVEQTESLLSSEKSDDEAERVEYQISQLVDRVQALTERLDYLLKQATAPLDGSCERVTLFRANRTTVLEIGPADRDVISAALTLPPPKRDWVKASVKFERINRKTGRALFHFEGADESLGAHFSRIVDPTVKEAHNRYTEAFNDDRVIEVWIRQTRPEPGRLNYQWEITSDDSDDLPLFNVR